MTPNVFVVVSDDPDCIALLGAVPKMRFYQFGEAPQGVPKPYAVYQMPTSVPANYLNQLPDMDDARIQIDVYADSQPQATVVAEAIRNALEPHGHMLNASQRPRDSETRNFGYMLEFEMFTVREPLSS